MAEFARRAGINRSSATRLAADKLRAAIVPPGRIDVAHPVVAGWARARGIKPSALRSPEASAASAPTDTPEPVRKAARVPTAPRPKELGAVAQGAPTGPAADEEQSGAPDPLTAANVEIYLDKPLRQVIAQFGNLSAFADEVEVVKKAEETRRVYLQNEESEGELISRELVRGHVFSWLDGLARKLLRDSAKTIVRRVYAMAKSGADIEAAEAVARENLSSQIQPAKAQIAKALRSA